MVMFENQSWSDMSRPVRWDKRLLPAMRELEDHLPGMLGANIWLHRNVSWSDLERIEKPDTQPTAGNAWPLMYLVCYFRKALLGIQLVKRESHNSDDMSWKIKIGIAEGLPCFRYTIDAENPSADLERVMTDICAETKKIRRQKKTLWRCTGVPIHFDKEGGCLIEHGFVKEQTGSWFPTERGEDCGLMTLFTTGKDGKTMRELRWSPSTWRALTGVDGPISFQAQKNRLVRGFAICDSYAADEVRRLAEMPLEEYFQSCPEVGIYDIRRLQKALGLQNGCLLQTAAAALYRRLLHAKGHMEKSKLMPLLKIVALPLYKSNKTARSSVDSLEVLSQRLPLFFQGVAALTGLRCQRENMECCARWDEAFYQEQLKLNREGRNDCLYRNFRFWLALGSKDLAEENDEEIFSYLLLEPMYWLEKYVYA